MLCPLYEHTIHRNEYVCVYTCAEAMMKCFLIFLLQKDVDIVNLAYKWPSLTMISAQSPKGQCS